MNALSLLGVLALFVIMTNLAVVCVRLPRISWGIVGAMGLCASMIGVLVWLA